MDDAPRGSLTIRRARPEDEGQVVFLLREMVAALEALGHHAMSRDRAAWVEVAARVSREVAAEDRLFLLAETGGRGPSGFIEARVAAPDLVFAPRRLLHVAAVYVVPGERRRGIARALVGEALGWGRRRGCVEAELDALLANPSRRLFSALGFHDVEVRMARPLGGA